MAVLVDAINVKRRTLFELENVPYCCLEAEVNTPTARGGQTLDQGSFETLTLIGEMAGSALDFLIEGASIQLHKYNGSPIDSSSGTVTKLARLETVWKSESLSLSRKGKRCESRRKTGRLRDGRKLAPDPQKDSRKFGVSLLDGSAFPI